MKIIVLNRNSIQNISPKSGDYLISITCLSDTHPPVKFIDKNILRVKFDDCDKKEVGKTPISEDIAKTIVDFILNVDGSGTLYINCDAGLSRSAGVGLAAEEFINGNYLIASQKYPLHNKLVYRMISKKFIERLYE